MNHNGLRILHVIPSLAASDGGPPKAVIEMCRELLRRNKHAEIYTTNVNAAGVLDVPTEGSTTVSGVKVTYFRIDLQNPYKISLTLASALRSVVGDYDLVHISALYQFPSTAAAHYSRKAKVPYIVLPHGSLDPYLYGRHPIRKRAYETIIERRNLAKAAVVQFTTVEEMNLARSLGLQFRGAVVPLGLDTSDIEIPVEGSAAQLWPELEGKRIVLFLGRINFKKGLDLLAKALGAVRRQFPDVHLVIAGPDEHGYSEQVVKWLYDEDSLDSVTFTGMVQGRRKAALLRSASMFVLSSYSENFGIAVVESMAVGLPVVISNKVNIWREVAEAGAGLVTNTDSRELACAMVHILRNPCMARQMGLKGQVLAKSKFSWSVAGDALMTLYASILGA